MPTPQDSSVSPLRYRESIAPFDMRGLKSITHSTRLSTPKGSKTPYRRKKSPRRLLVDAKALPGGDCPDNSPVVRLIFDPLLFVVTEESCKLSFLF